MFQLCIGIIIGIWLDQTFTIPRVQEYIETGIKNIKENQKKNAE